MVSVGPAYYYTPADENDGLGINTTTGLVAYPLGVANLYDENMTKVMIEKDGNYTCADDLTEEGWSFTDGTYYEYTKDSTASRSIFELRTKLKMTYATAADVGPSNEIVCFVGYEGLTVPITVSGATVTAVCPSVDIVNSTTPLYTYYYGTSDGNIMGVNGSDSTLLNTGGVLAGAIRTLTMFSQAYGIAVAQSETPTNTIYITRDNWANVEIVSIPNTHSQVHRITMVAPYISDASPAQGMWHNHNSNGDAAGIRLFRIYSSSFVRTTGPIYDASNTNFSNPFRWSTSDTNVNVGISVGASGSGDMLFISNTHWVKNDTNFQAINYASISGEKNTATGAGDGPTGRNVAIYTENVERNSFDANGRSLILVGRHAADGNTLYFNLSSYTTATWSVGFSDGQGTSETLIPVVIGVH